MRASNEHGTICVKGVFCPDSREGFEDYKVFNGGPHVAIDVERFATVTCNLPDGKQVTFSFIPYDSTDPSPACIDIQSSGGDYKALNANRQLSGAHTVIAFGPGQHTTHVTDSVLTCIELNRRKKADADDACGDLMDYPTGEYIRKATRSERDESREAERDDGGRGVIAVGRDGRRCYVQE